MVYSIINSIGFDVIVFLLRPRHSFTDYLSCIAQRSRPYLPPSVPLMLQSVSGLCHYHSDPQYKFALSIP